ncbi:MAG: PQQ-binding-like beta-propeller repeat protein [Verrucomicrobia bacterium]|nr:PQQ-binding-like beta-propeller repeat protein [Verrucomicrobiota bacterium]
MKTVFAGISNQVVAIDKTTGQTVWQTKLEGNFGENLGEKIVGGFGQPFVTLATDGQFVFAHTSGKIYCLEAETGKPLWKNDLPGLGFGTATLCALSMTPDAAAVAAHIAEKRRAGS